MGKIESRIEALEKGQKSRTKPPVKLINTALLPKLPTFHPLKERRDYDNQKTSIEVRRGSLAAPLRQGENLRAHPLSFLPPHEII
jgi:hypothetical protein